MRPTWMFQIVIGDSRCLKYFGVHLGFSMLRRRGGYFYFEVAIWVERLPRVVPKSFAFFLLRISKGGKL